MWFSYYWCISTIFGKRLSKFSTRVQTHVFNTWENCKKSFHSSRSGGFLGGKFNTLKPARISMYAESQLLGQSDLLKCCTKILSINGLSCLSDPMGESNKIKDVLFSLYISYLLNYDAFCDMAWSLDKIWEMRKFFQWGDIEYVKNEKMTRRGFRHGTDQTLKDETR